MTTYTKRNELREKTLRVGREWLVISVPGRNDSDPTLWFAAHRDRSRRSSQAFATYDEALAETRKRNGLA